MGAKQKTLERLLTAVGTVTKGAVAYPRYAEVSASEMAGQIERVYRALGGTLSKLPVGFRGWDIEFEGCAVELDEELHFNRYRALTLESELYTRLPAFPLIAYREYCDRVERECVRAGKHGGKWTNTSCESQFGAAGRRGDLDGAGAPRWKQRAFYDFVKDLSPLLVGARVARVSIWDSVVFEGRQRTVGDLLKSPISALPDGLLNLIRSRVGDGAE